jgi:hypothetical protein
MPKFHKELIKGKRIQIFALVLVILLLLLLGFFIYRYSLINKINNFVIKNEYYGFELNTPKNWLAEKNMFYSASDVNQLLEQCNNDKSEKASVYQLGEFRFKDQKYPQNLGLSGFFPAGLASGAILEIAIDCIPEGIKNKVVDYNYTNLKIGGEKTFESYINLPEFGKTKCLSLFHNNLRYKISEYVYISPTGKGNNEETIRQKYADTFNGIISSFKFLN